MDCSKNRGEEEGMLAHLIFCEVVASFFLFRQNGNLVVKTFSTLEHRTVCLMYLLVCCFKEVGQAVEDTVGNLGHVKWWLRLSLIPFLSSHTHKHLKHN